jgi:OmpA-OmpF porin, OOP family
VRAEAVRALLIQAGLAPERVLAVGYGHGRPLASDGSAAGRSLNRRVEIVFVRE